MFDEVAPENDGNQDECRWWPQLCRGNDIRGKDHALG